MRVSLPILLAAGIAVSAPVNAETKFGDVVSGIAQSLLAQELDQFDRFSRDAKRPVRDSGKPPVAMLEFLARPAGASIVPRRVAPCHRITLVKPCGPNASCDGRVRRSLQPF